MMDRRNIVQDNYSQSPQSSLGNSPQVYFDEEPYGINYKHGQNQKQELQNERQNQSRITNSRLQQQRDDELQDELMNKRQTSNFQNNLPENPVQQRIQKLFNETKSIQQQILQDQNQQRTPNQAFSYSEDDSQDYYDSNEINQKGHHSDSSFQNTVQHRHQQDRETSRFVETQLTRAKENNVLLSRRFEQAQEEIEKSHDQIARQAQHNHNLKLSNEKLSQELEELVLQHQELMQRQSEDAISYERRIEHLNLELSQYKKQLSIKDDNMRQLQLANDQYKDKGFSLENEISDKIEEIDRLKSEARKKEELLDQFFLNRGAETAFKIEMEQLREDNKRLMKLLKQTREYQDFANFVEDSGGHVRNVEKEQQIYEQNLPVDDENWVPQEAYQLAHKFRDVNGNDLTPNLVNQLLQDLNKIWREREKKQIQRIKQQTQNEILQLKRQLNHRTPFDELTAKKNISRLKSKLQNARIELSKTQQVKDKQKQMPIGVDLVDNTLQIITTMQSQRKQLEQENSDLKEQIRKLEQIRGNQDYDKAKYMEGAVWMGKRVSNEIEKVCSSIESLNQEYHQRTNNMGGLNSSNQSNMTQFGIKQQQQEFQTLQRAQVWFLEAVKACTFEMYEQTINMLESAVYHMEDAQTKIGHLNLMESVQRDLSNFNIRQPLESQTKNQTYSGKQSLGMARISEQHSEYSKSHYSSEGDVEQMFRATARFQQ